MFPKGYWAFGNSVGAIVLQSLTYPNWAVMLAWAFGLTQLVGTTQVRFSADPPCLSSHRYYALSAPLGKAAGMHAYPC